MREPQAWTLDQLASRAGAGVLATSEWVLVDQARIDAFARATGDLQWIHVDPERARSSPYGGTIAHGYLLVSLLSGLRTAALSVSDAAMSVNYGLNKVRFTSPVRSGSRVRAEFSVVDAQVRGDDAVQLTFSAVLTAEGAGKPACVAETISRYYRIGGGANE